MVLQRNVYFGTQNLSTIYLRVELAFARYKLRNSVMYCGKVLHADPCRACVTHGLGLILIGFIIL